MVLKLPSKRAIHISPGAKIQFTSEIKRNNETNTYEFNVIIVYDSAIPPYGYTLEYISKEIAIVDKNFIDKNITK